MNFFSLTSAVDDTCICAKMSPMVYHVYIMASESGVLYIGVTNHLESRTARHKQKLISGFTSKYNATKLVYFEPFGDIRNAIAREKQLKRWRRKKKVVLIERTNPTWRDLSADFPH
jgi:putative endonuclease